MIFSLSICFINTTPSFLHYPFITFPSMDNLYTKKSLLSLMDEEEKALQIRKMSTQDEDHDDVVSSSLLSSPLYGGKRKIESPEIESPWMVSPIQTPISPSSLLYHCIASLHRGEGNIYSVAVSQGFVFTASESCRVRVWKQPDCMERGFLKAPSGGVKAILAHGNLLFTSHKDFRIRVWNFTTVSENFISKKVSTLPKRPSFLSLSRSSESHLHKDDISCMAYYHAQDLLYTASHDKTVKAWRVSDKKCVDSFLAHEDKVNSIVVNQTDGCLFTCSSDGSVKIWRRVYRENSHTLTMTLKFQTSPVNALSLSSNNGTTTNPLLYSGSADGTINFWEKEKLSYRYNHGGFLKGHRFSVLCLMIVEKMIFSGSEDTTIRIWRKEEEEGSYYHECLAVLDGHRGPVRCLAATMEMEKMKMKVMVMGFLVYSGSLDQTFKVWRVKMVMGEEKLMVLDYRNGEGDDGTCLGQGEHYEMISSPVLSPSWVEKKLQGDYF